MTIQEAENKLRCTINELFDNGFIINEHNSDLFIVREINGEDDEYEYEYAENPISLTNDEYQ